MARGYLGTRLNGLFQPLGEIPMDWRITGFAAGVCILVAVLASILPSLGSARVDAARWLADTSPTSTGGGQVWRTVLGVVQAAAALPLLIGALLFSQTLQQLARVELGFDPGGIRMFSVMPSDLGYGPQEQFVYYRGLRNELSTAPGVRAVTLSTNAPLVGGNRYTLIKSDAATQDAEPLQSLENEVGEDYFRMLQIPLRHGRTFTADEVMRGVGETTDLVVLSASLAQRLFGTTRAVGRNVEFASRLRAGRAFRVIGVVGDLRSSDLTGHPEPVAYTPLGVDGRLPPLMLILVDGPGSGEQLGRAATEAARRVDPLLPLVPMRRAPGLADAVAMHLSERKLLARLFTTLSITALLLAGIGLYGTVARSVIGRIREIGVRKALGADPTRIFGWVLHKALATVLIGTATGCLLGIYGVRFLESRLYGVSGLDPFTWATAVLILCLVSLVAGALPARRAARLDPARALRAERS